MHRLFVAIRPPRLIRESLLSACGGLAGARWQTDDQLHLTLRFIGDVDVAAGDELVTVLDRVRSNRFSLVVHGAGTFSSKGRIHTMWAGVEPHPALTSLRRRIDRVIAAAQLPVDPCKFQPHITLARFGRSSAPTVLTEMLAVPTAAFEVHSFGLFESSLTKDGATYTLIERYTLG